MELKCRIFVWGAEIKMEQQELNLGIENKTEKINYKNKLIQMARLNNYPIIDLFHEFDFWRKFYDDNHKKDDSIEFKQARDEWVYNMLEGIVLSYDKIG